MATKQLRPMQIRIPDNLKNWLRAQARTADRSINWVVNRVLEDAQKKENTHG